MSWGGGGGCVKLLMFWIGILRTRAQSNLQFVFQGTYKRKICQKLATRLLENQAAMEASGVVMESAPNIYMSTSVFMWKLIALHWTRSHRDRTWILGSEIGPMQSKSALQ